MATVHLEVAGRVQGVGFRAWTVRQARALHVRGTVRNRPDGRVEVDAEGAEDALDRLRELLGRGPAIARVTEVRELAPGNGPLPEQFEVA